MKKRKDLKVIYLFSNGNFVVFDSNGSQVPELQGNAFCILADKALDLGWTVEQIEQAEIKDHGRLKRYRDPDDNSEWWNVGK